MENASSSNNLTTLYAKYIAEREGSECIHGEHGFITFKIFEQKGAKHCLVQDFFVEPEFRNKGIGKELFEKVRKVAIMSGASAILCWVDFSALNWQRSLAIIVTHGFRPVFFSGSSIQLCMELHVQPLHTEDRVNGQGH